MVWRLSPVRATISPLFIVITKCQTGNGALTPFLIHDQEANFHQSTGVFAAREVRIFMEAREANETTSEHGRIRSITGQAGGSRFFGVDQHGPDSHSLCGLATGRHTCPDRVLVGARRGCAGGKSKGALRCFASDQMKSAVASIFDAAVSVFDHRRQPANLGFYGRCSVQFWNVGNNFAAAKNGDDWFRAPVNKPAG